MTKRKIIILAANPVNSEWLRLDKEVKEIEEELRRSNQRDEFEFTSRWAVGPADIQKALLDIEPQIVHFSGHGAGANGLVFENEAGQAQLVSAAALGQLFKLFMPSVECVVLNACYSEVQALSISQHIDYVVGMNRAIGDQAAIKFATGFYRALGAGRTYEDAHSFGCNAISLENIPEEHTPILKRKPPAVRPQQVFISYRSEAPDLGLAEQLHGALAAAGHNVFMASESIGLGETWSQRVQQALENCTYFLLLLSPQSVNSEMVTEEVRVARMLRDKRPDHRPAIIPIRVQFPLSSSLNYDQRGYLNRIQQQEWTSEADTLQLLQKLLPLLAEGKMPALIEEDSPEADDAGAFNPALPPMPVAEPELPGGQVDLASQFYTERPPIERKCYEAIVKPGALIRVKAPRQMGKTSLMSRILRQAEASDMAIVPLSFQLADSTVFSDLDRFLKWFCLSVGRRLKMPNRLKELWDDDFYGSKDNCTIYFEEYLLPESKKPIVLGLDEVDMVFQHEEVASDFFGLLRAWHESGKTTNLWKKLNMVIVHSTEVYVAALNINQSPFNVGLPIELPEFTSEQVQALAVRHGLDWQITEVEQLMRMIGGHPYLVRVALYSIARGETDLFQVLKVSPTESGPYGDHLRRLLWNLEQRPDLMSAMRTVINASRLVRLDSLKAFQLNSLGLVNLEGNDVTPRCELYRQYFNDRLNSGGQES